MWFKAFAEDTRGNIAILFALAMVPILGMSGIAVDYSRASNVRTELQNALDATALAVAVEQAGLSEEELAIRARALLAANFSNQAAYQVEITDVFREEGVINIVATASMPMMTPPSIRPDALGLQVQSRAVWGSGRVEVALVLDNTGSMTSYGRMDELKSAAQVLLNKLEQSAYDDDAVKVSIIPFATQVNVGTAYEGAAWIIPPDQGGTGALWTGCIMDREQPYDVGDAPVESGNVQQTGYPAVDCAGSTLASIQPLTNDFEALRAKIGEMVPAGNTNITIGLAWGMASLSSQEPLIEADPDEEDDSLRRVMILLTDGDNTENRWVNDAAGTPEDREALISARTELACESAKEAGITVYTVRLMEGDEDLLSGCASGPGQYFNAQDVDDLLPAFESIATSIVRLHLAR